MYTCEDKSGEICYLRTSFCFPTYSKFTLSLFWCDLTSIKDTIMMVIKRKQTDNCRVWIKASEWRKKRWNNMKKQDLRK